MATVMVAILKDYQAGQNTDWKAGEIQEIEARDAEKLVRDGVACFYSEFHESMIKKSSKADKAGKDDKDPANPDNDQLKDEKSSKADKAGK